MKSEKLERILSYDFRDRALLECALTHSSFSGGRADGGPKDNERLEFLGDAFFDAIISEELFMRLRESEEGQLTKLRAQIVCEGSLAKAARAFGLGEYLNMGKGEENNGGRNRTSILADAMEAVIAAIYVDGGYAAARDFVLRSFAERIDDAVAGRCVSDYKTRFQELMQAEGRADFEYRVARTEGPDHNKTFFVELLRGGELLGRGEGRSKKEAEQEAARQALEASER